MKKLAIAALILSLSATMSLRAQTNAAKPNPLAPDYAVAPLADWEKKFSAFEFKTVEQTGHVLPYRFYKPAVLEAGKKLPLVVFFHGAGEKGLDNRGQFLRFKQVPPFWEQKACFVLAPQCPPDSSWVLMGSPQMKTNATWPMQMAMELVDKTIVGNPIDTNRVYITGLSMGGFATWEFLQRDPNQFAAAIPICGGADPAFAARFINTPIWVFHGGADTTVPPARSRDMVAALIAAGGHPIYTEYPGVNHDAWTQTYSDMKVWDWLFAQVRK